MTALPDEPGRTADERTVLTGMLDYYRAVVVRKCEGLTDSQAREKQTPTGLSVLGLLRHLTDVEMSWFRVCMDGEPDEEIVDAWDPAPSMTIELAIEEYVAECERSRAVTDRHQLDDVGVLNGREASLRWVLVHMIEECARHAGHLDVLRERLDGATGD